MCCVLLPGFGALLSARSRMMFGPAGSSKSVRSKRKREKAPAWLPAWRPLTQRSARLPTASNSMTWRLAAGNTAPSRRRRYQPLPCRLSVAAVRPMRYSPSRFHVWGRVISCHSLSGSVAAASGVSALSKRNCHPCVNSVVPRAKGAAAAGCGGGSTEQAARCAARKIVSHRAIVSIPCRRKDRQAPDNDPRAACRPSAASASRGGAQPCLRSRRYGR